MSRAILSISARVIMDSLLEGCGFDDRSAQTFFSARQSCGSGYHLGAGSIPWRDGSGESANRGNVRLIKDLIYFALVVAAVPLTALEAACGAGSTIMIEARKKA